LPGDSFEARTGSVYRTVEPVNQMEEPSGQTTRLRAEALRRASAALEGE
jgi:hypothetical protein